MLYTQNILSYVLTNLANSLATLTVLCGSGRWFVALDGLVDKYFGGIRIR